VGYGIRLGGWGLHLPAVAAYQEVGKLDPVFGAAPGVVGMLALHSRPCVVVRDVQGERGEGKKMGQSNPWRLITFDVMPQSWALVVDAAPERIGEEVIPQRTPGSSPGAQQLSIPAPPAVFLFDGYVAGGRVWWHFEPAGLLQWLLDHAKGQRAA
jgi:hypothetical protein